MSLGWPNRRYRVDPVAVVSYIAPRDPVQEGEDGSSSRGSSKCGGRGTKRKERDDDAAGAGKKPQPQPAVSCPRDECQESSSKVCKAGEGEEGDSGGAAARTPFQSLIRHAITSNPKQFTLPYPLTVPIAFPGESKSECTKMRIEDTD